jgi:hypothetical protein
MTEQTKAERLAEYLTGLAGEIDHTHYTDDVRLSAAELYRLSTVNAELLDALRRVMRHIPADAGGCSLADDMHRARAAIARATEE